MYADKGEGQAHQATKLYRMPISLRPLCNVDEKNKDLRSYYNHEVFCILDSGRSGDIRLQEIPYICWHVQIIGNSAQFLSQNVVLDTGRRGIDALPGMHRQNSTPANVCSWRD